MNPTQFYPSIPINYQSTGAVGRAARRFEPGGHQEALLRAPRVGPVSHGVRRTARERSAETRAGPEPQVT